MRDDDAHTPSGDQGQALRAKQSSVDALSGLGTKEGEPGPERKSRAVVLGEAHHTPGIRTTVSVAGLGGGSF